MFFAPSKSRQRAIIRIMGVSKTNDHIQIKIKMPNPSQEPPASSKAPNEELKEWIFFAPSKSRQRAKIWIKGISKTSYCIQIKFKMPNPSQEPTASSKSPNQDLKDMFFAPSNQDREQRFSTWVYQRPVTISKSRSRCQNPVRNLQRPPEPQMRT